jgi:hypothetical protein
MGFTTFGNEIFLEIFYINLDTIVLKNHFLKKLKTFVKVYLRILPQK